jgi:hypothetical protein
MTITKEMLKTLREDMNAALAPLAQKYGLESIKAANCSFTPDGAFTFKVEGLASGGLSKEESAYDANHKWMGLPPRGTEITHGKRLYATFGLKNRSDKVIVVAKHDGKKYLIDREIIAAGWKSPTVADGLVPSAA